MDFLSQHCVILDKFIEKNNLLIDFKNQFNGYYCNAQIMESIDLTASVVDTETFMQDSYCGKVGLIKYQQPYTSLYSMIRV